MCHVKQGSKTMDGQVRFMGARKTGRRGGWTRIRDRIQRKKRPSCLVERSIVFGSKSELA